MAWRAASVLRVAAPDCTALRAATMRQENVAHQRRRLGAWAQVRASETDPYSILGVSRGAQRSEIKEAFRKAALKTHPDTATGSEDAFRRVQDAYKKLLNPASMLVSRLSRRGEAADGGPSRWEFRRANVRPMNSEELFQKAFGKSVEQTLDAEMAKSGIKSGVHSNAIREGMFAQLLRQARAANEAARSPTSSSASSGTGAQKPASPPGGGVHAQQQQQQQPQRPQQQQPRRRAASAPPRTSSSSSSGGGGGGSSSTSREKLVSNDGRRIVRVKTSQRQPDGSIKVTTVDKPVYRM